MPTMVRAYPIPYGMRDEARRFVAELKGRRHAEFSDFLKRNGVIRETWYYQEIPSGVIMIICTETEGRPPRLTSMLRSETEFEAWLAEQVFKISAIDLAAQPGGPPSQLMFDWARDDRE